MSKRVRSRGSALLAVLWLSAALSAIAFSVALTVRGETERVATSEEDVRAYYLAEGALDRAMLYVEWSQSNRVTDDQTPYFVTGQPRMYFHFPGGDAAVDIIPEAGKLSLNDARPGVLAALMMNLGANPDQASTIAAAIADWRKPAAQPTDFDQLYLSRPPSFRSPHTSFQTVEELLYVAGMTPDLFYGTWVRDNSSGASRLVPRPGVRDAVSVYGSTDRFDVNTVAPAVLAAVGVSGDDIQALVERRRAGPILGQQALSEFAQSDVALLNHLAIGTHTIYTFRATARLRRPDGSLSDMRRVVAATVKFLPPGAVQRPFHILRWYDRG